jgi:hypothetical protein
VASDPTRTQRATSPPVNIINIKVKTGAHWLDYSAMHGYENKTFFVGQGTQISAITANARSLFRLFGTNLSFLVEQLLAWF